MSQEQFNEMLDAFDAKAKDCASIATMKAHDFVRTNDAADRASSQDYATRAELWKDARRIAVNARATIR
jgi:hypothetical protein